MTNETNNNQNRIEDLANQEIDGKTIMGGNFSAIAPGGPDSFINDPNITDPNLGEDPVIALGGVESNANVIDLGSPEGGNVNSAFGPAGGFDSTDLA